MISEATPSGGYTADRLLADAVFAGRQRDQASADLLHIAATWADLHPALDPDWVAYVTCRGQETDLALAGDGTPSVDVRCIPELGAALEISTEGAQLLIGDALELRHRLPWLWSAMLELRIPAWQARQIAQQTRHLPREAAAFVDRQLGALGRFSPSRFARLVDAAIDRYAPEVAVSRRVREAEKRRVDISPYGINHTDGLASVSGVFDLADALDLDALLTTRAADLRHHGCQESEDVRRSIALGDLARGFQGTLDLLPTIPEPVEGPEVAPTRSTRAPSKGRQVVLYVHLSEAALTGATEVAWLGSNTDGPSHLIDRPLLIGQVRGWCGRPDTTVVIKPVVDLNDPLAVNGYQPSDRILEHLQLRDRHCTFPGCVRRRVDADHIVRAGEGPTSTDNLAPLCRRHHRMKTHTRWRYRMLRPGVFVWTSPRGRKYLRDSVGTFALE